MYRKELINSGYCPDFISNRSNLIVNAVKKQFSSIFRNGFGSTLTHDCFDKDQRFQNKNNSGWGYGQDNVEFHNMARYILEEAIRKLKELFVDCKVEWIKKDVSDVDNKITSHYLITIDWS